MMMPQSVAKHVSHHQGGGTYITMIVFQASFKTSLSYMLRCITAAFLGGGNWYVGNGISRDRKIKP